MNPLPPLSQVQYQQPKTSALAIWALVLGILSVVLLFICLGFLFAIPAIICGHLAYSRIKKSGGQLTGQGLAIAGFATGYVSLVLIVLLSVIAVPNFIKARDIAQRNACIKNLRQIDNAKHKWAQDNQQDAAAIPTEADLVSQGIIMADLKCLKHGSYTLNAVGTEPTCSIPEHSLSSAVNSP